MDFELNSDQLAYVSMAKNFAEKELAPNARKWDQEQVFPRKTLAKAGELGLFGLYASDKIGGLGLSRIDASIIFEQLAMGCTSTTAFITIHNMATWMVGAFGNSETTEELGSPLTAGTKLISYCLTEPGAGSDAASLKTSAKKHGHEYVLNGSKIFISGAGDTDTLLVMARTGAPGSQGISAFVVDAKTNGITYGRKEEKMGWNSQPTRVINFENVKVPAQRILGSEGDGFKIAMKGLDGGRINIAACSVGTAQAALDQAKAYSEERKQFGRNLSEFQNVQFKLADMLTALVASRQMVRLAAFKLDSNDSDVTIYSAMAKRFATDECYKICDEAMQIFGGLGYMKEYPLERFIRDTRVHRILEGTNEIMRVIIAQQILQKTTKAIM